MPFASRHALVIGGGRNIGRAIALEIAMRGARVSVADIDFEGAQETAELVRERGGQAIGSACDVASEASIRAAGDMAEEAFGAVDLLFNNAGILSGGNPEDIPLAAWQRTMDVNVLGMVRAIGIFLPAMLARGSGHIVNTASFAGLYPYAASRLHYAASKAAVLSMSENLALYCLPKGVGVHCLCPGPVMTTSNRGMENFSDNYVMHGPGSELAIKSQAETARILAEGIAAGRIVILTHEEGWETIARHAAAPDEFLRARIAEFDAGDHGRPRPTPDQLAELGKAI